MISPEEITLLAKDAFGHNLSRVWQVNKATIRIKIQNKEDNYFCMSLPKNWKRQAIRRKLMN